MEDVYAKIDSLKADQKEIMRDIRALETRTTINEKDIATINKYKHNLDFAYYY